MCKIDFTVIFAWANEGEKQLKPHICCMCSHNREKPATQGLSLHAQTWTAELALDTDWFLFLSQQMIHIFLSAGEENKSFALNICLLLKCTFLLTIHNFIKGIKIFCFGYFVSMSSMIMKRNVKTTCRAEILMIAPAL